jgi:hypothetical protein
MASGLPSLPAAILAGVQTAQLDATVLTGFLAPIQPPTFGIFNPNGGEVLTGYASVLGFGFQRDQRIASYPIEQGGFANFNKVALPFSPRLTYRVNGGQPKINAFLATLEQLVADTNLYTVVNPWYAWENANVVHYDFKQTDRNGGFTLIADVWLAEVRQAQASQFSTKTGTQASQTATQSPEGQAQQQNGTVQLNALGTSSNPFAS